MGAVIAITGADASGGAGFARDGRRPQGRSNRSVRPPLSVIRRDILEDLEPHPLPQSVTPANELALIRATARGDRAAFKGLYDRYAPRLGRYVLRLLKRKELVGEVVNDVMLVAWQSAARFDPAASRLSTWLFGIAHNKALKALERMGARREELLE
jgi:Sigma-70 region 2